MTAHNHPISTSAGNASPQSSISERANALRFLAIDAIEKAKSGHPGMPMGMADIATVLFSEFLTFDPRHPSWPNRDRFILSNGHGCMLQYALLYVLGYDDMPLDQLQQFRQLGALTAGHPEYHPSLSIETTTGPLGQGLANGVGMALAEAMMRQRYGQDVVDHKTVVFVGDGCLMEGISHEAMSMAGHWRLNNLIVVFDDNGISIDGPTSLATSDDHIMRAQSYGWNVVRCDGHDEHDIRTALKTAWASNKPTFIAAKTTIGFGAPTMANTHDVHGKPLGADEIAATRQALNWPHKSFEVPAPILADWRNIAARHSSTYQSWQQRVQQLPTALKQQLQSSWQGDVPHAVSDAMRQLKKQWSTSKPNQATRKSSQDVLTDIAPVFPTLVGGSADLTPSTLTQTPVLKAVRADDMSGRYIHFGIREHGMAAALNGMALHGGFTVYGATFFSFTDYCKPAIRLSALMRQRVIYIMTHDSIGLGEDGPTHQPIEHLAAMRAIPHLLVMRPADAIETAECWDIALHHQGPSIIALSRQNVPLLRDGFDDQNLSARGAYLVRYVGQQANPQVTLMATGSEVSLAIAVQAELAKHDVSSQVISMPSFELFEQQPLEYRSALLPSDSFKVAIEAGVKMGWEKYVGHDGLFFGVNDFGASAPYQKIYEKFGLTAGAITPQILKRL